MEREGDGASPENEIDAEGKRYRSAPAGVGAGEGDGVVGYSRRRECREKRRSCSGTHVVGELRSSSSYSGDLRSLRICAR
ncbi:hypothetical protein ACLOJK_008114 [Asimina triloba]